MENTFNAWGSSGNSSFPTYDFPSVVTSSDDDKNNNYMFGSTSFSQQRGSLPVDGPALLPSFTSNNMATPIDTFDFHHHNPYSGNSNNVQFPTYGGLSNMMDSLSLQPSNPITSSSLPVVDPFQIASFAPPPMFSKPSNASITANNGNSNMNTNNSNNKSNNNNNTSTNSLISTNNNNSNLLPIDSWEEARAPMLSAKAMDFQPFTTNANHNNNNSNNPPNGISFAPGEIPPGMILIDNEGYAYDEDGYLDNGGLYDDDEFDDADRLRDDDDDDEYYEGDYGLYDEYDEYDEYADEKNMDGELAYHADTDNNNNQDDFYYSTNNTNILTGGVGNSAPQHGTQGMSYANAALKDFHMLENNSNTTHVKKSHVVNGASFHVGKQEGYQSASVVQYNHHDRRICPFFLQDSCKYGNMCKDSHDMGVECFLCHSVFTTPDKTGYEESVQHMNNCREMLLIRQEKACSKVHHCNLCGKLPFECNERYGILTSCVHAFCLACIKDYRRGESNEKDQARRCPICRIVSHYVIPCDRYIDDSERKERLISQFQQSLSSIPCAKFNFGNGTCPFGSSCFYAHVDEHGNNLVQRAKFTTAEGEVKLMNDGTLSDLIDWGQGSFKKLKSKKKK